MEMTSLSPARVLSKSTWVSIDMRGGGSRMHIRRQDPPRWTFCAVPLEKVRQERKKGPC